MKVAFWSWWFNRDVAVQHLIARCGAHAKEYFSFHITALIIGRVEQFMSNLEQEIQDVSSARLVCNLCRRGGCNHLRRCAGSNHSVRCA